MTDPQKEPQEDPNQSFWMPGNYVDTVQRTQNAFQVCEDIVACFKDRARVEKRYAQQLKEWSSKWKSIADSNGERPHAEVYTNVGKLYLLGFRHICRFGPNRQSGEGQSQQHNITLPPASPRGQFTVHCCSICKHNYWIL
ncbi:hypothetical protein SRHO_G00048660 [Serrasalmus rhombeus]